MASFLTKLFKALVDKCRKILQIFPIYDMKKIYYLGTCDTCKKIMSEMGESIKKFQLQDIKTQKITALQLDEMKDRSGSYESLFSRRALKYKQVQKDIAEWTEEIYRDLILQEYTFLKRPVVLAGKNIFIGSEKKVVERMLEYVRTHK